MYHSTTTAGKNGAHLTHNGGLHTRVQQELPMGEVMVEHHLHKQKGTMFQLAVENIIPVPR